MSDKLSVAKLEMRRSIPAWICAAMGFVLALGLASLHPVWPLYALSLVAILVGVSYLVPTSFAGLVPIALVAGDAYPWTGQLLLQEYDYVLMASAAGVVARCHPFFLKSIRIRSVGYWIPWILSLAISSVIAYSALLPLPWDDSLGTYFSRWNSLRIIKGTLWGCAFAVLFPLIRDSMRNVRKRTSTIVARSFAVGMMVAILYVTGFIVLERAVFESIFDFSNELRVTGPFFTMHIGDQHVDAFLSLAFPWVAYPILVQRSFRNVIFSISLLALAIYATFATMSRGTIAAVSIEVVVLLVVVALRGSQSRRVAFRSAKVASEDATFAERKATISDDPSVHSQVHPQELKVSRGRIGWGLMVVAIILCTIAVSILAMSGDSAVTKRFGSITKDLRGRWEHWRECVFRDDLTPMQLAFGNGVGTLPSWMAKHRGLAVPPLSKSTSSGVREVIFQPGWPIYLEHWLGVKVPQTYMVHMSVSTTDENSIGSLGILRCQKSLLSSYQCDSRSIKTESADQPMELEIEVASPKVNSDESFWHSWRPESIGFSNAGSTGLLIQRAYILTMEAHRSQSTNCQNSDLVFHL